MLSLLLLLGASSAAAFWRLPCDPLVVQRADPLTNPGTQSMHVHTIAGGSNFNLEMSFDYAREGRCSSCLVKQDMSNYWTPNLYFHHANGSFTSLSNGGMTVYYLHRSHSDDKTPIQAFPDGLRMLAGDPYTRSWEETDASKGIGWNCLGEGTKELGQQPAFPDENCPMALRGEIVFPSCWNGKDVDSANHISHMAYPIGGEAGPCPAGFDTRVMTLFYEVWWNVDQFKDSWNDAKNTSEPFVTSQGDGTGYGWHGDFLNGWDPQVLQDAVDKCTDDSGVIQLCDVFDLYDQSGPDKCTATSFIDETALGTIDVLPGHNPVSYGPDRVTSYEEEDPPKILGSSTVTGGRTDDHEVAVRRGEAGEDENEGTGTSKPKPQAEADVGSASASVTGTAKAAGGDSSTAQDKPSKTADKTEMSTSAAAVASQAEPLPSSTASSDEDGDSSSSFSFSSLTPLQLTLLIGGVVLLILIFCVPVFLSKCTSGRKQQAPVEEERSLRHRHYSSDED